MKKVGTEKQFGFSLIGILIISALIIAAGGVVVWQKRISPTLTPTPAPTLIPTLQVTAQPTTNSRRADTEVAVCTRTEGVYPLLWRMSSVSKNSAFPGPNSNN